MNVDEVKQTPREGDQQCRPPSQPYRGGFGGRGSRGRGRFNSGTHRKLFCVFCGEDKGHTTRFCEYTKQKQEELRTKNSEPKLKEVANIPQYCPVNYGIPNVHALSYSYQQPRPAQQQLPPTPTFQALPPPPTYQPLPPPPPRTAEDRRHSYATVSKQRSPSNESHIPHYGRLGSRARN